MTLSLVLAGLLWTAPTAAAAEETPGLHWATCAPEEAGLDAASLEALAGALGGRGCVVRHGKLAYAWGDISERADVASAAKPVYAHLLHAAVESGLIGSVDDPIAPLAPGLEGLSPSGKDGEITWRQLASQTACYGLSERPGCAFAYNDWQMALFVDTLFGRVYGASWSEVDAKVLRPLLAEPLGCEDAPTLLAFGAEDRPGRLAISVRDFARFGLLYLREGRWGDRQLLAPARARRAVTQPLPGDFPRTAGRAAAMLPGQRSVGSRAIPDDQCDHLGSYSWLWWVNGIDRDGARHWAGVPADAFGAFGHGGPRAVVAIPSLDLVVSWNDAAIDSREKEARALAMLVAAVREETALGAVCDDPATPQALRRRGGERVFPCGPGDPEGFLYRGTERADGTREGDQSKLIAKLAASGANCLYAAVLRSHGGDGDASENPFVDHDPRRGLNEAVLAQWEGWLAEADAAGVTVLLFLYDDSARVWETGDVVGTVERAFVQGLVGRLGRREGIIWCVAEEAREAFSAARIRALAAEIRAADPLDHPIAVHLNHGLDFSEFAGDPNITRFAVQYNVPTAAELHAGLVDALDRADGRYGVILSEAEAWGRGAEARHKAWACALAGVPSMGLGMDIENTPVSDLEDCGRLAAFLRGVDPGGMAPHDELAAGETEYVLAAPGERYLAYSSQGAAALGIAGVPAGPYWLTWLDCVTGRRSAGSAVHEADGLWELAVPQGLGPEVAVLVRRM